MEVHDLTLFEHLFKPHIIIAAISVVGLIEFLKGQFKTLCTKARWLMPIIMIFCSYAVVYIAEPEGVTIWTIMVDGTYTLALMQLGYQSIIKLINVAIESISNRVDRDKDR
jgi:hypothetical protein